MTTEVNGKTDSLQGIPPEGRYFIGENVKEIRSGGPVSASGWPNAAEARRALAAGLIDFQTYLSLLDALQHGQIPNHPAG
jgi:hypothetical protein